MDETITKTSAPDDTMQVRSGSAGADSGQSSSAETSSNRSESICADSLEDNSHQSAAPVKNYLPNDAVAEGKDHEANNNNISPAPTPIPQEDTTSVSSPIAKQPLKSALVNNNNNNFSENNLNAADIVEPQQQQQQKNINKTTTSSGGNNFSGLNLNMTASEMRELLARRKKFDPKKAQMNIRQKYEIIQQM